MLTSFVTTNLNFFYSKEQNCEKYNRINALSVFIDKTEQQKQQEETLPEHMVKLNGKLTALSATKWVRENSRFKYIYKYMMIFNSLRKSHQKKSKKTAESKDPVFYDNNKQCFGKYNCTNIYVK